MNTGKKVLLIAGGGTLGTYTREELIRKDCEVDVICLEDNVSDDERLKFYKACADLEFLQDFLNDKFYDAIVNFVLYTDVEAYKPVHELLTMKTKQLVFLSSYRVYADLQHPITESAPQLFDVLDDERFLTTEDYAVPKSKSEKYIREESKAKNWTIVRPVISFSSRRLDIVTVNQHDVIRYAAEGRPLVLPAAAKNLTAGLDWAGNSGKLIANLLFKEEALGEDFTVSSAQNLKWSEVADYYTEIVGTEFDWVDNESYLNTNEYLKEHPWALIYDRAFDRKIDNSKILRVTGLKTEDFLPIKDGIKLEVEKIKKEMSEK